MLGLRESEFPRSCCIVFPNVLLYCLFQGPAVLSFPRLAVLSFPRSWCIVFPNVLLYCLSQGPAVLSFPRFAVLSFPRSCCIVFPKVLLYCLSQGIAVLSFPRSCWIVFPNVLLYCLSQGPAVLSFHIYCYFWHCIWTFQVLTMTSLSMVEHQAHKRRNSMISMFPTTTVQHSPSIPTVLCSIRATCLSAVWDTRKTSCRNSGSV